MQKNSKALRWLKEGKKRYANDGIKGININEMSKSIGVSKTSFYFHFKTKEEYLKHLYNYWIEEGSTSVMNKVAIIDDLHARFRKLMELAFHNVENDKFLFQLRMLAYTNSTALQFVKRVENKRKKYATKFFTDMGYP
jgi:AcrR family transcriptional regulator